MLMRDNQLFLVHYLWIDKKKSLTHACGRARMPQLVNLSVKFHPDARTERNQMPEMLQVFVNVGAKFRFSLNRITGQFKWRAGWVSPKGLICLRRGGAGCGREGSESENKSKTNLQSGTRRAATQEGLMGSRGLWNDVASEWGEWP